MENKAEKAKRLFKELADKMDEWRNHLKTLEDGDMDEDELETLTIKLALKISKIFYEED